MAKDFLNSGILGVNISAASGRGFRPINTDNLPIPKYDGRYFETFPTVWANAYAFRKELETSDQRAVEEWTTLFLLHYFGVLYLESFDRRKLEGEYDKDLWLALAGTYPRSREESELQSVGILRTADHLTVGAYYPQTIFFPSRGRDNWEQSENLRPYLEDNHLSWKKASAILLQDDYYKGKFQAHLLGVPNVLPLRELRTRMEDFCNHSFGAFYDQPKALHRHPSQWETEVGEKPTEDGLLEAYPLKRANSAGGFTYYLLNGIDLSYQPPWLKTKLSPKLPAPVDYLVGSNKDEIIVQLASGRLVCRLEKDQGDKVELLKDLFLPYAPYFCKLQREAENFANHISLRHEIALQDGLILPNEKALCLAPFAHDFVKHFPEVLSDPKNVRAEPTTDGNVTWKFTILGKEIAWRSVEKPRLKSNLQNLNLALYPPKVSTTWKLYTAHGTGDKESGGRWHLIDENGWLSVETELEEDEYVTILHREGDIPNRPKALLFRDGGGKEGGILFLSDIESVDLDVDQTADLAVDFGTSNTCLAVKTKGTSQVLKFSVSPRALWGQTNPAENPGFVPKKWSGNRGFFPTILFSRKHDARLPDVEPENIRLEHLLKTDIPGLHRGINDRFADGVFNKQWRPHTNLKWDTDTRTPWRSLFLELILLYAHAEVFFNEKRQARIEKYVFTYPLAFSSNYGNTYHNKAKDAISKIRHYCYGEPLDADINGIYGKMDESSAIARSINSDGVRGRLEVFADIGGGTADIAIRHQNEFLVLDSVKVAGQTFFQFAKKNFEQNSKLPGAVDFRKNLNRVIRGKPDDLDLSTINSDLANDLGSFYAIEINELDESAFEEREENVLRQRMGEVSYQRYRSRLFFHHILTYALLQACATVIDQKIVLSNKINLILGGNGWGLLLFAELSRKSSVLLREARDILTQLKLRLAEVVTEEERLLLDKIEIDSVDLLNEESLSKAKTSVALGALYSGSKNTSVSDTSPYAGMTIRDLTINDSDPKTVRWCDRWSFDSFTTLFGRFTQINSRDFAQPDELKDPIDETLSVFTGVGNTSRFGTDNSPDGFWMRLNSQIVKSVSNKLQTEGERLSLVPINYFLSEILYPKDAVNDMLDKLADSNLNGHNRGED